MILSRNQSSELTRYNARFRAIRGLPGPLISNV